MRLFPLLKFAWSCFWLALITIVLFIPVMTLALISRTGNLVFEFAKIWAYAANVVHFVKPSIRGREKIEKGKAYVIVSNHQSLMDIPTIVTKLGVQFRWIIKRELLFVPLFGYSLYAMRNVFIDRSDREQTIKTINKGIERLPPEAGLLFFAEGTRSPDGKIHEFKKGAFVTAIETGLPILPITINGSRKVLPKGSLAFTPGRVEVVVGDPIKSREYTHDQVDELIQRTRNAIIANFDPDF